MKKLALKSIKTILLQNAFSLIVIVFQQTLACIIILKVFFFKKCLEVRIHISEGALGLQNKHFKVYQHMCKYVQKSKLPFCGIFTLEN